MKHKYKMEVVTPTRTYYSSAGDKALTEQEKDTQVIEYLEYIQESDGIWFISEAGETVVLPKKVCQKSIFIFMKVEDEIEREITEKDIGKEFEIVGNRLGHEFDMGEVVTIRAVDEEGHFKCHTSKAYWWVDPSNLKRK